MIPSSLNVENGQNATLQVITDGHMGGLHNVSLPKALHSEFDIKD